MKMMKLAISLFASGSLVLVAATAPSIGIVKSTGEFRVDGSAVRGNGNVFEGNLVESAAARSVIQFAGGQITLGPDSSARVYRDRIVLEKGAGSVKESAGRVIEAATLRIVPSTRDSVVQIEVAGPTHVTVATRGGAAEVRNSSGILTASLRPGMALVFNPQAAAATAVRMTGVIELRDGAYFLTDQTTKVTAQIEGTDVSKFVGKKVEIVGSSIPGANPASGAPQLVRAVTITPVKSDKRVAAAAGAGAAGAAAAGATAGLSGAAIGAIVGGVSVAGAVGGLVAAGTFSSDAPVSRR